MNQQIFDDYLCSLETIAAETYNSEYQYVIDTINSLPDEYKEKVMECINIALEAGKESNYG